MHNRTFHQLPTGVSGLDAILGGGLPEHSFNLISGPPGSGKTTLAHQLMFAMASPERPALFFTVLGEPPGKMRRHQEPFAFSKKIALINTRSLDLSIDEIVQQLIALIKESKATRVVIDSLSGFELAVAPTFREDFRESLFRMVSVLASLGVTVLMTSELEDRYTDLRFSPYGSAFLTDAIIVQRYVEVNSALTRVMAVIKVRGSAHSRDLRQYDITNEGIVIGDRVLDYEGILGGRPRSTQTP